MSTYPQEPAAAYTSGSDHFSGEKAHEYDKHAASAAAENGDDVAVGESGQLARKLKSRHMQMIAIGGAIGAGFFVGSGGALANGGPASLILGFIIVGIFLLCTMQALAEMAVLFPVNGAFFQYSLRFMDRSWGFAVGWDYALSWLTVLPFEITAAGLTIQYWPEGAKQNVGVWVTVFLVALTIVQVFGVRGYGEVEFVLSVIKVTAIIGFIILAIVIDCGGVSTDDRGYIGGRYWSNPGAFNNGFHGFCSVFVNSAFAFAGTELSGLAAAEAANPMKSIPQATKQVFWRISLFYVVGSLMVGLIVPSNDPRLLNAGDSSTEDSPYVLAIANAGIKGLPSVMNAVITISVLSVANSCTFGSTRTIQALAGEGMAPKFLAYIDKHGRPIWCVILQLAFGLLAFINEAPVGTQFFDWLLAFSGLAQFFVWGSICMSHVRFRAGWKAQGHTLDEIPYKAAFGVWGSIFGVFLAIICLIATFYVSIFPVGGSPSAVGFFQEYLSAFIIVVLYVFWKVYARDWSLFIRASDMDVTSGMRHNVAELREMTLQHYSEETWANLPYRIFRSLF